MAKKKVTRKKTRPAPTRKPSAAKKPVKKKTTKKKTTKKVARKPARKPAAKKKTKKSAKKPVVKKKTTKKPPASKKKTTKKAPAAKVAKKTSSKRSRSSAPKVPAPDANGYVIINGRRVRMMSVSHEPVVATTKKTRSRVKNAPTPEPDKKARKPVKTKLSKKDLDHYRTMLLIQRAELVGDLSAMEAQALQATGGHLSHMPIHMADVGTDTFDQDFLLGLAETERQRLREIDAALKRIEEKTYGICQMTDKVIPKTRLNAKPWAQYTIEAAREIERGVGE